MENYEKYKRFIEQYFVDDVEKIKLDFNKWKEWCINNEEIIGLYDGVRFDEMIVNGEVKKGNSIDYFQFGEGLFSIKKLKFEKVKKYIIGECLSEVIDVLKRLNGGFFDSWEFIEVDNYMIDVSRDFRKNKIKNVCDVGYGKNIEIRNNDIGRLILSEFEDDDIRRIKIDVIEIWGKRLIKKGGLFRKDEYKGGVGKSILTILNRVCKGLDILIELNCSNVRREKNNVEYDFDKLKKIYESRGFVYNGSKSNKGIYIMDSRVVLEEYAKRMGWEE